MLVGRPARQEVARDLLQREPVERQVPPERLDHPVPVAPCMRAEVVPPEAVAVGVARQIQPEPRPLLGVVRRVQQAVDQSLVAVRSGVGRKCRHLAGRRREPGQVQAEAADQRRRRRFGRRVKALPLQTCQHEPIDLVPKPCGVRDARRLGPPHRLEGPVGRLRPLARAATGRLRRTRPRGPLVDPRPQQTDLARLEGRARGGHDPSVRQAGHHLQQLASRRVTGQDDGAGIAAPQRVRLPIQPQTLQLAVGPVAGVATRDQQRPDLLLKIDGPAGRPVRAGRLGGDQRGAGEQRQNRQPRRGWPANLRRRCSNPHRGTPSEPPATGRRTRRDAELGLRRRPCTRYRMP